VLAHHLLFVSVIPANAGIQLLSYVESPAAREPLLAFQTSPQAIQNHYFR
jgi:hypothetical protein